MIIQRTLSIIKPNAVKKNLIGDIYNSFKYSNFKIIAAKMIHLNKDQAISFYSCHKEKIFFNKLIDFMISGPIMIQVLIGHNIIQFYRNLMGATDPKEALPGTLRALYSDSLTENAVHGSDCIKSAEKEINFFFTNCEIYSY